MTTCAYDRLYELTGAGGPGQPATAYAYDPAGNRTSAVQGASSTAYAYDKADRLTAAGALTATSDADGNLTGLSGAGINETFAYDQANRLTGVTFNGATTTDAYNGDGLRMSQTTGGTTTTYVNDVNRALPVVLSDGARTYVYGLGLAYSVDAANTVLVYHTDGLGSVRALTDGSGNVVQTYQTDAFGVPANPPGSQGTASQPFGYTGQQADATGLVYLRARYYAPALGRFMSRDPVAGDVADPLSLNRYTYVTNDPTRQVDPSGMCSNRVCVNYVLGARGPASFPLAAALLPAPAFDLAAEGAEAVGAVACIATGPCEAAATGLAVIGAATVIVAGGSVLLGHSQDIAAALENVVQFAKGRNSNQDTLLSPGEIRKLQRGGIDVHDLKGGKNASKRDLYKGPDGEIYVKPKGGSGPGEDTGVNINDY